MILSNVALTSCAVSGVPSWNSTPLRMANVQVLPSLVGDGSAPSQRSHW